MLPYLPVRPWTQRLASLHPLSVVVSSVPLCIPRVVVSSVRQHLAWVHPAPAQGMSVPFFLPLTMVKSVGHFPVIFLGGWGGAPGYHLKLPPPQPGSPVRIGPYPSVVIIHCSGDPLRGKHSGHLFKTQIPEPSPAVQTPHCVLTRLSSECCSLKLGSLTQRACPKLLGGHGWQSWERC